MFTVMIVEDEALIRFSLRLDLEENGYTVLDAANADEAVDMLAADPSVRVVITDIDMPGSMDGLGLARHIDRINPDLPVILVSGKAVPRPDQRPPRSRFLPKPFLIGDVLGLIETMTASSK